MKNKHLTFKDRCTIQEFLTLDCTFTEISKRIKKDRTTISKEVKNHRFIKSHGDKNATNFCNILTKPPYVCNACKIKRDCKQTQFLYDAAIAHNEYKRTLSLQRANLQITKSQIASINETIAPLMVNKHHSVNQVFITHPELLPFSKSTFYRYIDLGLLNVKNIDLQRKVRFKVKKEYDYTRERIDSDIRLGRMYHNFQDYIEIHPNASIVEMDTVIGTNGGKGGKCFLTLLFRQFNFMLIYLMPYKKVEYVNAIFKMLKDKLGDFEYSRLFEVVLTDNGSEFSDPVSIEVSLKTGERLSNVFYCDPNSSWQKGSIEKNHEYIRYVLPKGTSFAGLTQEDCFLLASHINSVPRVSLNNLCPFEAAKGFIGQNNIKLFKIQRIDYDDINLTIRLLKK